MSNIVDALLFDMLSWLAPGARPYAEVMDAWRTSCPRLTVWEDALEGGMIERVRGDRVQLVRITPTGLAFLTQYSATRSDTRAGASNEQTLCGALLNKNRSVHVQDT
jgi:predicted transcriptional regulator